MANSEYNLTVVNGTALTISLGGLMGGGGSSTISTSTLTTLTGYIYGNGTNIAGATVATSTNAANSLVLRNATGGTSFFGDVTVNGDQSTSPRLFLGNVQTGANELETSGQLVFKGLILGNTDTFIQGNDGAMFVSSPINGATYINSSPIGASSSLAFSAVTGDTVYQFPNASGSVPVYTGAAAVGKVLTSSGTNGAATWETPAGGTVDATIINGSTNAVSGNAVFDALADKAPKASPEFTGTLTSTTSTSQADAIIGNSTSGYGVSGISVSSYGVSGISGSSFGVFADSTSGVGINASTVEGTYHATFGFEGIDQSFVARVKGAFGWIRGSFTGRIHPPDTLTADRTYTLPNDTGTVALTNPSTGTQTFTGTQIFTTRPTSSGSGTPATTSLVTRTDVDTRLALNYLRGLYLWGNKHTDYTATHVGTGSSATNIDVIDLSTGATASSVSFLRSNIFNFRVWHISLGTGRGIANWSLRTIYNLRVFVADITGADTVARFLLGQVNTNTTAQDFTSADRGIGFKIIAGLVYVQVANATILTTTSTATTLIGARECDFTLDSDGAGNWVAYINGSNVASGTGAPTGNSTAGNNALCMSLTNGTTAAIRQIYVVKQSTLQIP